MILLVEDNPADVELIRHALRRVALEEKLIVLEDGDAAIRFLVSPDQPRPSLVLLDLNLPKRNGDEVLSFIRSQEASREVPVLVLTSSNSPSDRRRALELGANQYLYKPNDLDEFLAIGGTVAQFYQSQTSQTSAGGTARQ